MDGVGPTKTINASYERLRIVAALGIVAFHTQEGALRIIGYAGLPIFVLLMVTLAIRKEPADLRSFVFGKAWRLLLPWLFWVALYLGADVAVAAVRGRPLWPVIGGFNPFFGTRIHLWFLPFAFCALVGAQLLHRRLHRVATERALTILAGLAAVVWLVPLAIGDPSSLPEPAPQWIFTAPCAFLGMFIAYSGKLEPVARAVSLAFLVIGTLFGGVASAALIGGDTGRVLLISYAASFIPFCVATLWTGGAVDRVTGLVAPLTYGIYLSHPFLVLLLYRIEGYDVREPVQGVLVLFAASAVLTAIFRAVPLVKRVV